jgi:rhamnosyltransferase subunit B
MRVLLATDGTWGDVGPLAAVASELRTRGHAVRALLNPSYADDVERQGLEVERVGVPWEERLEGLDPADFMKPISGTLLVLQKFLIPEIAKWALATARAVDDFRPDAALVHHLAWGPLRALSDREVPMAAAFLAPTVLMSADDPGRPAASFPPPPRWLMRTSRPMLHALFRRLLQRRAALEFEAAGYAPPRDLYFYAHEASRAALGLWSRRLRGPARDDPPGMTICGAAFPVEPDPLDPELESFLQAGDPPVVVTLGTSAREMGRPLYQGAADACARLGCRAVLLTGTSNRPERLPNGVVTFASAPHGRLLPRACAVVHHAGAGTGAQVLRSGRPAVIVPFGHDQIDNAFRAERLGVARVVPRKRASVDRLARSLELVLGDERVLAAAREVGEFVGREQGASVAADQLERLAPPGPEGQSRRIGTRAHRARTLPNEDA